MARYRFTEKLAREICLAIDIDNTCPNDLSDYQLYAITAQAIGAGKYEISAKIVRMLMDRGHTAVSACVVQDKDNPDGVARIVLFIDEPVPESEAERERI